MFRKSNFFCCLPSVCLPFGASKQMAKTMLKKAGTKKESENWLNWLKLHKFTFLSLKQTNATRKKKHIRKMAEGSENSTPKPETEKANSTRKETKGKIPRYHHEYLHMLWHCRTLHTMEAKKMFVTCFGSLSWFGSKSQWIWVHPYIRNEKESFGNQLGVGVFGGWPSPKGGIKVNSHHHKNY